MDILLSKYGVIFTKFESIDLTPYLLSKKSIIVYYRVSLISYQILKGGSLVTPIFRS